MARTPQRRKTEATKPPRLLYEHHSEPLLPRAAFVRRVLAHGGLALIMLAISLVIGVVGYRGFEGMSWVDAFLNASMILGGMGPVGELHSDGAKVFAACYALFSGVVFLARAGVLFAPVLHRLLHRMHMG